MLQSAIQCYTLIFRVRHHLYLKPLQGMSHHLHEKKFAATCKAISDI